jgi:CDP-paratose 2-epimerase
MKIKSILITGGCGFVGSNLLEYFHKKNYTVYSIDNLSRKGSYLNHQRLKKIGIRNLIIDISKKKNLSKIPKSDLIIDCCAETSVEVSKKDTQKVFNTNLIGTLNILEKCKKDHSKIIFLSTSRTYSLEYLNKIIKNKKINKPIKIKKTIDIEFNNLEAKTFYGYTKFASEQLIKEFSYLYKVKYLINRCGVVSGPWQFGKVDQGFVSLWIWNHIQKKNISYIGYGGHGHQVRDILHVNDLCKLIYLQIKNFNKINNITLSVGGGVKNSISLVGLTKLCNKITNFKIKIKKISKTSNYDIPYFVSSIIKVQKIYNWKPEKNIYDIVNDVYDWQKKNINILKKYF